jgi:putative resolvase
MKAKSVLSLLNISRATLTNLVKTGKIRVVKLSNNYYDYNSDDVYNYLGKSNNRLNVVYARVSGSKNKKLLESQLDSLKSFCDKHSYKIDKVFKEVATGVDIDNRPELFRLIDLVLDNQVSRVFILYKDRFGKSCFGLFKQLFARFGTQIIVVNEQTDWSLDSFEMFDEMKSLLSTFASWDNLGNIPVNKKSFHKRRQSDSIPKIN